MTPNRSIGSMICTLVFVALARPGHAAESITRANAAIRGEGRFYRTTENMILFSGFFQGGVTGNFTGQVEWFEGTVLRTSLSNEQEARLRQALQGVKPEVQA
jgi:hypothetical protein